jgi:Na+-transporting NADH:ubiquinone oxidoreductase subunit B
MGLEKNFDDMAPHFEKAVDTKNGALYEAADTIYSPSSVTKTTAHVRDGQTKRVMITVWF